MADGICLGIMVKNEESSILATLGSVVGVVSHVRVFDTGSTDTTLEQIEIFAASHPHIDTRVKQGAFVNFEVSRNELLAFCEEDPPGSYGYILLLDSNDVLEGGPFLKAFLDRAPAAISGFQIRQKWSYGGGSCDVYFNVRLIRSHHNWRYKGVVHEYIASDHACSGQMRVDDPRIVLFQDRTLHSESSATRFARDYELLLAEHVKDPTEPRTLFYLAQTCSCLGKHDEAYYYYTLRTTVPPERRGFTEEIFHAYLRMGDCAMVLGMDYHVAAQHYLRAMECMPRAEPACKIAALYLFVAKPANYTLAHMFVQYALGLSYPHHCNLFVNDRDYTYTRYHLGGITGWYTGERQVGEECCAKAIAASDLAIDKSNMKFYTDAKTSAPDIKMSAT